MFSPIQAYQGVTPEGVGNTVEEANAAEESAARAAAFAGLAGLAISMALSVTQVNRLALLLPLHWLTSLFSNAVSKLECSHGV